MATKSTKTKPAVTESEEPASSGSEEASDSAEAAAEEPSGSTIVSRGVKIAGEAFVVPGSSLILDGNIVSGGLHVAGGIAARVLLGPIGWFAVAANSYSKSVTGKHVTEHVTGAFKRS